MRRYEQFTSRHLFKENRGNIFPLKVKLEAEKKVHEIELNSNLKRRYEDKMKRIGKFGFDDDNLLDSRVEELQTIQKAVQTFGEKISGEFWLKYEAIGIDEELEDLNIQLRESVRAMERSKVDHLCNNNI